MLHIFIGSFCILFFFWKIVLLRVKMDCKNKLFDTSVLRFTTKCLVNSHGTFFRKEQMEIFSQNLLPYLRNLLPYLKRTLSTSFWVAVTYVLIENSYSLKLCSYIHHHICFYKIKNPFLLMTSFFQWRHQIHILLPDAPTKTLKLNFKVNCKFL